MNAFNLGDRVKLSVTFKNTAGTPTDPLLVTFKMVAPDHTAVSYTCTPPPSGAEITRDSTGVFTVYIDTAMKGLHAYRWEGTGTYATVEESEFYVNERRA